MLRFPDINAYSAGGFQWFSGHIDGVLVLEDEANPQQVLRGLCRDHPQLREVLRAA